MHAFYCCLWALQTALLFVCCLFPSRMQLMTNLDFPAAVKELGEAVSYLKSSGATKVGVVGFCMGGALTFAAAQHAGVNAAAPFYGIPDPAICDVSVPVLSTGRGWQLFQPGWPL